MEEGKHLLEISLLVLRFQIIRYLTESMSSCISDFGMIMNGAFLNEIVDDLQFSKVRDILAELRGS